LLTTLSINLSSHCTLASQLLPSWLGSLMKFVRSPQLRSQGKLTKRQDQSLRRDGAAVRWFENLAFQGLQNSARLIVLLLAEVYVEPRAEADGERGGLAGGVPQYSMPSVSGVPSWGP
jgi:hypothetical protein